MQKVYFLDVVHEVLKKDLIANGFICEDLSAESERDVRSKIRDAYGLVIRSRFTLNAEFLKESKNLKFIARSGSGLENIDMDYCKANKVEVYNSPEGNKNAVADHCLGLLLSLLNKFKGAHLELELDRWDREKNRGLELENQLVGIIGFGHNGSAFAKKLEALGTKTMVFDKYKSGFSKGLIQEAPLSRIFELCSVISFHVPLTEETLYMADYQFFKSFFRPVFVLNISRGKVVRTKDLCAALKEGLIRGAGLDVLEEESSSFDMTGQNEEIKELNAHANVILTPHVAGWTEESYFKLSKVLSNKILKKPSFEGFNG